MSEITMKTIETLPLVEEPAEGASLVGWNNGQTVRMPVGAVGGSKGIVITAEWQESEATTSSLDPLVALETGAYVYSCNYNLEEFTELAMAGSPIVYVDTYNKTVCTIIAMTYTEASERSVLGSEATSTGGSWNIIVQDINGNVNLFYDSTGLYADSSSEK